MKALITLSTLLTLSLTSLSHASTSDQKLKTCITSVYSQAVSSVQSGKDTLKSVSLGVKDCRQSIAALKKEETKAKKAANNAKRIEKLKAQLLKLSSSN